MTPQSVPYLPRGVRCAHDRVRGVPVLLGPERVLMLDQIGTEVLSRVTGTQSVRAISEDLARTFAAPRDQIETDVMEYLGDLAEKRLVEFKHA
ncbi:pyrroloquinoline quinone biosynthesis peptide chaperone PqqD [Ruegeria marina]|uniref:Pyrroloquinoline quinone biosynthesis protein D n=1 Tax=Ruegeria marina TaxID=639004 RepID=A0A1G6ZM18_9RHOB|nr:pyrroloquinoline quinone biosynthesis peptide chaperone PqqD [Ruegeria marina]SDE03649.1 pyrroloquinoline quinone biosynthesis protein D [Ruegeria marina]